VRYWNLVSFRYFYYATSFLSTLERVSCIPHCALELFAFRFLCDPSVLYMSKRLIWASWNCIYRHRQDGIRYSAAATACRQLCRTWYLGGTSETLHKIKTGNWRFRYICYFFLGCDKNEMLSNNNSSCMLKPSWPVGAITDKNTNTFSHFETFESNLISFSFDLSIKTAPLSLLLLLFIYSCCLNVWVKYVFFFSLEN